MRAMVEQKSNRKPLGLEWPSPEGTGILIFGGNSPATAARQRPVRPNPDSRQGPAAVARSTRVADEDRSSKEEPGADLQPASEGSLADGCDCEGHRSLRQWPAGAKHSQK